MRVISLGSTCFPKVMATKHGFKRRRAGGETSTPFDLACHSHECVIELVRNDFDGYLHPANLFVNTGGILEHRTYDCTFSHESCDGRLMHFIRDDCAAFVSRYADRVRNFQHACTSGEAVVFVLVHDAHPVQLRDAIQHAYPGLEFKMVCMSLPKPSQRQGSTEAFEDERGTTPFDRIYFKTIPLPYDAYVWWKDRPVPSFEQSVGAFLGCHLPKVAYPCLGGFDEELVPGQVIDAASWRNTIRIWRASIREYMTLGWSMVIRRVGFV